MSLLLKLIASPWFWADVVLSVTGGIIVWWGLKIEKRAEQLLPPDSFDPDIFGDIIKQQKAEEDRGWRILMTGIVFEVIAALGISVISGLEIAGLEDKAGTAIRQAGEARQAAGDAKLQTALANSNNFVTLSNVASLQVAVIQLAALYDLSTNALAEANARLKQTELQIASEKERDFSNEQIIDSNFRLRRFRGIPFAIIEWDNPDSSRFATKLTRLLAGNGWEYVGNLQEMAIHEPAGVTIDVNEKDQRYIAAAKELNEFFKYSGILSKLDINTNDNGWIAGGKGIRLWIGSKK